MKQYKIETTNEYSSGLIISNIKTYSNDIKIGNKYNTEFDIQVFSQSYSGKSTFTVDVHTLEMFVSELYEMYETMNGSTSIQDISLGSTLSISIDNLGVFLFNGVLFDLHKEQSLYFKFECDQTCIEEMIIEIYNDIMIDKIQKI